MSRFKLPIGGDDLALDEAELAEQLHHDGGRVVHDRVAHAFAEVAETILSGDGLIEAGQLPVAAAFVGLLEIVTEAGIVGVTINFCRHLPLQKSSLGKSKRVLNHWFEPYHASLSPPARNPLAHPQQM
jgi:hypothetical protein